MAASCSASMVACSSSNRQLPLHFNGLRGSSLPMPQPRRISQAASFAGKTQHARSISKVRCDALNPALIITLSNGALLFLGRFVFLPFQRSQVKKAGLPVQNGVTHFEAGDGRAAEASGFLKTGDPAGFTLVDVLAWGALGHAVAFFILATASNGYDPTF